MMHSRANEVLSSACVLNSSSGDNALKARCIDKLVIDMKANTRLVLQVISAVDLEDVLKMWAPVSA